MMRLMVMEGSGWSGARELVGRRMERALLRHLVRQAADAVPAMAVIAGPPGAGKTAMLRWLASEGAERGAYVLRASASGTTLPFASVRRLLAPLPAVARTIPGSEVAVVAAEALIARARRRLLMVRLDDAQDLERESRLVLDELLTALNDAGTRHGLRLVVAVTAREPLARDGLAERLLRLDTSYSLTLGGLDEHEVFELLTARDHQPSPTLVRRLIESTGGLPLLLESEVASLHEPPHVHGTQRRFERRAARLLTISEAIGSRLDRVGTATGELLGCAAALGEPWELGDLTLMSDLPRQTVHAMVESAAKAQLVERERDGMRFAHPLVRSELLDRLGDEGRRSLHRAIAVRLVATGPNGELDDEQLVRVVDHMIQGEPDASADLAEMADRAGHVAMEWGAWHRASRFFAVSAEASAKLQRSDADIARRHLDAGRAAYLDLDWERCERLLACAITHARRSGDGWIRLTSAMFLARQRGGALFRVGERVDVTELEDALDTVTDVAVALQVEARAALAEVLIISGDTDRALAIIESARRAATGHRDPGIEASLGRVDFAEGIHRLARLEMDVAVERLERGRARAAAGGDMLTEVYTRSRLALAHLMEGSIARAREELSAVEELARARAFWGEAGLAAAQLAFADTLAGEDGATSRIEQAYSNWRRTGFSYITVLLAPVVHALAARTRGLDDAAASVLPSLRDADLPVSTATSALAAVDANDAPAVRVCLSSARWRTGFRGPVTQNNSAVAVALVEVGDLLDDHALVRSARTALDDMYAQGVMVVLGWPALVPRLLAVVARHEGDLSGARRFLDHAIALVDRELLTVERARVLLERARLDAAAGAPPADVAAGVIEAARIFDQQSMHGWAVRCDQLAQSLGLPVRGVGGTSRERTIFTDDVVGSTAANAQMGDALYLEQLRIHDRLVRARLREFRGLEIKHTGDGLNAAFDDPDDAMYCALAALDDIQRWRIDEPELALQIRCGLARGPVIPSGGDFFGLVQSQAARLCNLAAPGELLATAQVVEGFHSSGVHVESVGSTALRGLPFTIEVFRVRPP